ncbi:MAG TPA: hypothetical protein VN408_21330 [Actinoplanes sp.]|nr:hypothetical protein [Actinoplanes sp.]
MSEDLPPGGVELSPAAIEALGDRWANCWTPRQIAGRLAGTPVPWFVAAGWAIDLFLGRRSRDHGDLEIAVPAGRFAEIRGRFGGHVFDAAGSGRIWADATDEQLAGTHQTWLRDPGSGDYLVDVFREPHDGDTWICRRDPSIRFPSRDVIRHTADGVPYLMPELVLLFKAKHLRPKDRADFDTILPELSGEQRDRLGGLLSRVHPGHTWLSRL